MKFEKTESDMYIPYYISRNKLEYQNMSSEELEYYKILYTPLGVNRKLVEHRVEYILNSKGLPKKI